MPSSKANRKKVPAPGKASQMLSSPTLISIMHLAHGMGVPASRANSADDCTAVRRALAAEGPVLIEVKTTEADE
ncbi:MAG: hypothetical protein R2856_26770 [Caldilineaceae bacterium]